MQSIRLLVDVSTRKIFYTIVLFQCVAQGSHVENSGVHDMTSLDLESFPTFFKDKRISLGYTQSEVTLKILESTEYAISQTTISLLECNKLQRETVEALYQHLMG